MPTVPSTSQPPRRGRRRNTTSSASTGVCDAGSCWSRTLDALRGETRFQVFERRECTLSHVPASLVPDLEVIQHANDEHVLRESAALAIVLQDLNAPVRIEEHVESGGEIPVLELTSNEIELRQLRDFLFELAPLVFGEHVEPFVVVGRDHETIAAGLAQSLAEFRWDAEPSLRVDRVPEMSPKHCPPGEAQMPLLPLLNHTSWDFIPLRGPS